MHADAVPDERALRRSLGIPADAGRVLVFAESSHWDPDWLETSEVYFDRFVRHNLDVAIAELRRDPRRVYSVECMFFLRMYWERCPQQRDAIRALVNERRLRLTSSGVTTADTLLPHPEAILRGFLLGQAWLRRNGMTQEPRLAYFPDSFGSSPALPSLLKAAGFQQTAITRIDGMYFLGFERNDARKYPRPGSSAERLMKGERSLDFVWRDRSGAQMLCHWNAFTYGQGDLLAYRGLSRNVLFPLSIPDRSDRNVTRRIHQFVDQLQPYSRTPYLFCPIGFDFVAPIPALVSLLDRYNEDHYPHTGIWVLNGGLDDYLDLVNFHRDRLPVIELDPNPYWTGFYSARPALKRRCRELVNSLRLAEDLSFRPENSDASRSLNEELERVWWTAAVANHHDFITGTSPDRVVEGEQIPWLEAAQRAACEVIEQLAPAGATSHPSIGADLPQWSQRDGRLEIKTPYYRIELDEGASGAIVRAEDPETRTALLDGVSNDLVSYRDSGGLWRMGYEFPGGVWKEGRRASEGRASLDMRERDGGLEVFWTSELDGESVQRLAWFRADSPLVRFRLIGRAARRRTVTARFASGLAADRLVMDAPGGVVPRPAQKVYTPTFWPVQRFVHVQDAAGGRGLALFLRSPSAVSLGSNGALEVVALRNALRERAYGLLPLSGNPARGFEKDLNTFDYSLQFTPAGDWKANDLATTAYAGEPGPWTEARLAGLRGLAASLVAVDRSDVWVMADKPATRGEGWILRLYTLAGAGQPLTVTVGDREVKAAFLCDARERDIEPLEVHDGRVHLTMPGAIASLRLLI